MKIFLCWSEDRSKELAELLKNWLIKVCGIAEGDIFFSPEIEKGTRWFDEVQRCLEGAEAAIICFTPENIQSSWMHFEAGVVLGRLKTNRIFPLLFQVRSDELTGPLSEFQGASISKKDSRKLAEAICGLNKTEISADYDIHWKELEEGMQELKLNRISQVIRNFRALFQRKTFNEPLYECTNQTWADRYSGARDTWKILQEFKEKVAQVCEPYQQELFNQLISTIDGYAGLLKSVLIEEKKFWISEAGNVDFTKSADGSSMPGAIAAASERRLRQIQRLVFLLDSQSAAAVMPESVEFANMSDFAERKEAVSARQKAIRDKELVLSKSQISKCQESIWEFDRIVFYLHIEHSEKPSASALAEGIEGELERLRAAEEKISAMPLHYSIRALLAQGLDWDYPDLNALLDEVEQWLMKGERDSGGQIKLNMEKIRKRMSQPPPAD
jgi:TIR domain-containing protein